MVAKIEEILGKKPGEIPLREDTQKMIDYAETQAFSLSLEQMGVFYRRLEEHYRALAQLDGIRGDMIKAADYFAAEAKETEN